jgi:hypothetical protein
MSTVAAVAAVVGVGVSIVQGNAAQKAAKARNRAIQEQNRAVAAQAAEEQKARSIQNASTRLANQRAMKQRVAEARLRRAAAVASGANAGVLDSSALAGAAFGTTSAAASDIGAAQATIGANVGARLAREEGATLFTEGSARAASFQSQAARHEGRASQLGGIAGAAGILSNTETTTSIGNIFK